MRQLHPSAVITDETSVYWLNFGPRVTADASQPVAGGALMRVAK